jgi:hypothetical protein
VKRLTWTVQKNFTAPPASTFVDNGYGSDYSSRGSNAFILNEIKKALTTWSGVADLEFAYIASGTADWVFEFRPSLGGDAGVWAGGRLQFAEDYRDFGSFPEDAPPPGVIEPPLPPYRSSARDGNGWLYEIILHEVGHGLGFSHAWEDRWDYHYDHPVLDNNDPQLMRSCDPGGPCRYPLDTGGQAPDFSVMDYRNGDRQGRHPRGRVLTDYDVYYARAMYGQPDHLPLIEMVHRDPAQGGAQVLDGFVWDWAEAGRILDHYSYVKHADAIGGRETYGAVRSLLGVVRPWAPPDATWKVLYVYYRNDHKTLATDTTVPPDFSGLATVGRIRTSSGGGYTQPLYRHRAGDTYRVTKSSTPPSGYVFDTLLGYTKGDAGVSTDNTHRLLDDGGIYQLVNVLSGKPVGTSQFSNSNGTAVVNAPAARAQGPWWRFWAAGDGAYRVIDDESARVLDTVGSSTADGVTMNVWSYVGSTEQEWLINTTSTPGVYTLAIRQSGKCLHVPSNTNGVQLQQRTCNGSTNQQFRLAKRGQSFDPNKGFYKIVARNSGKVLDVSGASTADEAVVQQWSWNGNNNQKWRIGSGLLRAKHSLKVVEIRGASKSDGAYAQQFSLRPDTNQFFEPTLNSQGYFQLINSNSQKCLTIQNNSTSDGARVLQMTCGTGTNQQFDIQRVE